MAKITLTKLTADDREQFILDNQRAFKYGAMEEFGERDDHFEEDGEIISRKTIEHSIDNGVAYRIREDGRIVGGLVLTINEKTQHNHLDLLFVDPAAHSKGLGQAAWKEVERLYPQTKVWETGEENDYEGDDSGGMFRFEKVIDICHNKVIDICHNKGYHI